MDLELLAPAGNMEQALYSIEAGCAALYGGLAKWNARMRADNFSIDEYKRLKEICARRGVKFYMTLNTLLRDSELETLLKLFADADFVLPDAVIVADVGLMKALSENFPDVALHASTQYGAYSVEDINFLNRYNVKRVILARELTFSEILAIRAKTELELEIFVYGSQCICFSGQCLWSGLTQERSGNRGRCSAPCRDFYCHENLTGQLLYPQDLDALALVGRIAAAGINGIKIEGRFRNSKIIAATVKNFRRAIDAFKSGQTEIAAEKSYLSYLGNELPVKSMFHAITPRLALQTIPATECGAHDFVTELDEKNELKVTNGDAAEKSAGLRYIKTIFFSKLNSANDGAVVELSFIERVLAKITLFDNLGRQRAYELSSADLVETALPELVSKLKGGVTLSEVYSNVPEFSSVYVNQRELLEILSELQAMKIEPRPIVNAIPAPSAEDYFQVDSAEALRYLKNLRYRNFIFDITSKKDFEAALEEDSGSMIYRLPLLDFTGRAADLLERLRDKFVMATRFSHLPYKERYGFAGIFADYTLNVWNGETLSVLKSFGVENFTASPEISFEDSARLSDKAGLPMELIRAGKIPLGYTRACFSEMNLCDGNCGRSVFEMENVTKGYRLQISCRNELGYRTIFASSILHVACEFPKTYRRRYIFSQMSVDEIQRIFSGKIDGGVQLSSIYGRNVL